MGVMADGEVEDYLRSLLPIFHPVRRRQAAVECSLCCALVVDTPGARNYHGVFHASLWRLGAGLHPFPAADTEKLRAALEEVDRA
jgi:hypothetical protein